MKKVVSSLLSFTLIFMFSASIVAAQPIANTLSLADDEDYATVYSIFGPGYDYLFDGGASVANLGNGKVSISAFSSATQRVDSIGVQVTLQQWTGSTWIDVYKSPNTSSKSSANTYRNHEVEVSKGYYYRAKSYHWIQHGDTKEEGTLYTGSILIPDK
ncbi:MAG: hypothetical protein E6230_24830 [Paenibacillus dendritiformis]|uniref:hypothetical protein n=1 Tax=uncultured Paenibacillus sp. TaxID=227322 RepID=UPI0025F56831|nr:hypothetical protein [uncultured Paenibacillus sp.]MDU5145406.1 hypothetical protein [Paenibacillus dendritiformis]